MAQAFAGAPRGEALHLDSLEVPSRREVLRRRGPGEVEVPNYTHLGEVGVSSRNPTDGLLIDDRREARYYSYPEGLPARGSFQWDLNEGYDEEQFTREQEGRRHRPEVKLDRFERFISSRKEDVLSWDVDFVVRRGIMTNIFCAPYDFGPWPDGTCITCPWGIRLCKCAGMIFVYDDNDEKYYRHGDAHDAWHKLNSYRGWRLENYLSRPKEPREDDSATSQTNKFSTIFRFRLGEHTFLSSAEVDAELEGADQQAPEKYVEFKSAKADMLTPDRQEVPRFKSRMLRPWAQCSLAGVPLLVYGFKTEQGFVEEARAYDMNELEDLGEGHWKPDVCKVFANQVLTWLKMHVTETDPFVEEYRMSYEYPFDYFKLQKVCVSGEDEAFLTRPFVESIRQS